MKNTVSIAKYKDRLEQIYKIAKMKQNCISFQAFADMLKDKNDDIQVDDMQELMEEVAKHGISIIMSEDDEVYEATSVNEAKDFIPAEVNISSRNITVDAIVERLIYKEINLAPNFQRRSELWTEKQQSQLIESLMLKIPLPTFYFDASKEAEWNVIDGLQRLTAFKNFMVDKTLKLVGLEYLRDFEGYTFEELPRQYCRRIRETQITIYTVEKGTPDDVVFNIFKRINTGGLVLSPQEIRHALYQGKATILIDKMVQEPIFREMTSSLKEERMNDREYATRFIAFTELDYQTEYKGNIDSFLTKILKKVNRYEDSSECDRIYTNFSRIMKYCYDIFGKYAFRRVNTEYRRGPINKAIFELWSICFNRMSDNQLDVLVEYKEDVLQQFINLLLDRDYASAIKAGDKYSLEHRVNRTTKMLERIIDDRKH